MLIHIPRSPDANTFVSLGLSVPVNYSQGEVLNKAFHAHQQHRLDIMPQNFSSFWVILFFKKHTHKEQSLRSIKWCHDCQNSLIQHAAVALKVSLNGINREKSCKNGPTC